MLEINMIENCYGIVKDLCWDISDLEQSAECDEYDDMCSALKWYLPRMKNMIKEARETLADIDEEALMKIGMSQWDTDKVEYCRNIARNLCSDIYDLECFTKDDEYDDLYRRLEWYLPRMEDMIWEARETLADIDNVMHQYGCPNI